MDIAADISGPFIFPVGILCFPDTGVGGLELPTIERRGVSRTPICTATCDVSSVQSISMTSMHVSAASSIIPDASMFPTVAAPLIGASAERKGAACAALAWKGAVKERTQPEALCIADDGIRGKQLSPDWLAVRLLASG